MVLSLLKVENENWTPVMGREICVIRKILSKNVKTIKSEKNLSKRFKL